MVRCWAPTGCFKDEVGELIRGIRAISLLPSYGAIVPLGHSCVLLPVGHTGDPVDFHVLDS